MSKIEHSWSDTGASASVSKKDEVRTFLLTGFIIIPGATVGFVGAFGLVIWVFQMIAGPPGPPA